MRAGPVVLRRARTHGGWFAGSTPLKPIARRRPACRSRHRRRRRRTLAASAILRAGALATGWRCRVGGRRCSPSALRGGCSPARVRPSAPYHPARGRPGSIDLHHQGVERVIGAYLLETRRRARRSSTAGRRRCLDALKERLARARPRARDVRHLLLSHIHLDHAGAAGALVREHPGLHVHVSGSARRTSSTRRGSRRARDGSTASLRRALGRARARPGGERPHRRRTRVGLDCFPSPGPRVAPRLLPRRRRDALRRRRGRRPHPAEPVRAPAGAAARVRPRRVARHARRDRAARAGAARAHPLRRRRRPRAPPRASCATRLASGRHSSRPARRRTGSSSACTRGSASSTTTISRRSSARCRCGSPDAGLKRSVVWTRSRTPVVMGPRRRSAMGECEARTQGALVSSRYGRD